MAEEEVNYASVVFKNKKNYPREDKKEEETVYAEVKVQETTEQNGDTNTGILPDKKENDKHRHNLQLACCLGILCVTLLLGVIAVCIYLTLISHDSERRQLKENITSLQAVNQNLTNLNHKLRSENEKLWQDHNNLTVQISNLTQDNRAQENKIANVTEENQNLKTQNQNLTTQNQQWEAQNQQLESRNKDLETQNQELETQKKNLTETIQNMETQQNELNVSHAQWSIDAYCPRKKDISERKCEPCQKDWLPFQSSCFVVINPASTKDWKTWDEAREVCKGKFSDLAVIDNQDNKKFISDHSWGSSGTNGYWIGLRVEDENWKWVDGTDLNETSWIEQHPATDGHCAISVKYRGWISVNCSEKNMWICVKKALTV